MRIYLGDAVYADEIRIGNEGIELYTSDGLTKTNTIILEPETIRALLQFLKKLGYIGRGIT